MSPPKSKKSLQIEIKPSKTLQTERKVLQGDHPNQSRTLIQRPDIESNNRLVTDRNNSALSWALEEEDPVKKSMIIANYKLANTYRYPANLGVALCHKQANRLGKKDVTLSIQNAEDEAQISPSRIDRNQLLRICPCCENTMIVEEFSIECSTTLHTIEKGGLKNQLPIGSIMYFMFIKMVVIFLLIRLLLFDIYNLYLSNYGNFCNNRTGNEQCVIRFSAYNLKADGNQQDLPGLDGLSFVYVLVGIVLFVIFRKIINKQKNLFIPFPFFRDNNYTIFLEDIPPFFFDDHTGKNQTDYHYQSMIEKIVQEKVGQYLHYLKDNINSQDLTKQDRYTIEHVIKGNQNMSLDELKHKSVAAVTICYDLTEIDNIQRMRQKLLKEYTDKKKKAEENKQILKYIPNRIRHLNEEQIKLCKHFEDQKEYIEFKLTHFTGKAFVSFEFEHYKDYFIRKNQQDKDFLQISGYPIKISYANQPEDVSWQNMRVSEEDRKKNMRYSSVVLIMLLIFAFAGFFALEVWQNNQNSNNTQQLVAIDPQIYGYVIAGLQALINVVINMLLVAAMNVLSVFQRHKTKSDRLKSLSVKIVIAQAINTCFIYGIFFLIYPVNPLSSFGIVNKLLNLIFLNCLVTFLLSLVPIPVILNWFTTRKYVKRDLNEPIDMFQIELNKKLEYPQFDFPKSYSFYIVVSYVVSFYGYVDPFLTVIPIIFFTLQYWADKYNLLKRFTCPNGFDLQYTQLMVSAYEANIFFFALGYFIWDQGIHYTANGGLIFLNVLGFLIAGAYVGFFMFTNEALQNRVLRNHNKPDVLAYSDYMTFKINKFAKTFYSQNPATSLFKDIDAVANYISDSQQNKQREKAIEKYGQKKNQGAEKKSWKHKMYTPKFKQFVKDKINIDLFMSEESKKPEKQRSIQSNGELNNRDRLRKEWREKEELVIQDKRTRQSSQEQQIQPHTFDQKQPVEVNPGTQIPNRFDDFDLRYTQTRQLPPKRQSLQSNHSHHSRQSPQH